MQKTSKKNLNINLSDIKVKDLKPVAIPLLSLLGLILVGTISFRIMINKMKDQKAKLDKARQNEKILEEKQRVLSEFDAITTDEVSFLAGVLPDKNSSLLMLSQIKKAAQKYNVTLMNLSINPSLGASGGLQKTDIQFDADGSFNNVLAFTKSLEDYSPVKTTSQVRFINASGQTRVEISFSVYSSDYPTKIPSITEPVKSLSSQEQQLLTDLTNLIIPTFADLEPQVPSTRNNPFQ